MKITYSKLLNLLKTNPNADETVFYFSTDPDEVDHYIGYSPEHEFPYWIGYCDIEEGCEFKTAEEMMEAPVFEGKSIKDRWDEIIIWQIGGLHLEYWETELNNE